MYVFTLDKRGKPMMPVKPEKARKLLDEGRAVVHKMYPFTIRIKDRISDGMVFQRIILKIDPGSRHTGIAVVRRDENNIDHVLFMMQINHRGDIIRKNMEKRKNARRGRRSRNRPYRSRRFWNRKHHYELPPSLIHRVDTVDTWVYRLIAICPIESIEIELTSFDTRKMWDPDVTGKGYQESTVEEMEVMHYLMHKYSGKCVYCGKYKKGRMTRDHVHPKCRGGSNRVSNLVLSCYDCNHAKGKMSLEEFLKDDPEKCAEIRKGLKEPLRDAAAVNITKGFIFARLLSTGLPVSCYSGGRTAFNRKRFGVPKDHAYDALCVGEIDGAEGWKDERILIADSTGHVSRQRQNINAYGFPTGKPFTKKKENYGFRTGDYVRADIPRGKFKGTYRGRISIRDRKYFGLSCKGMKQFDVNPDYCTLIQRKDGYRYDWK